jgi:hypothetical protein
MTARLRLAALALAALAAPTAPAAAQTAAPPLPPLVLDSLITPASPALVLLGASPVTIERPTTPKAVALALASAVRDADGVPKDVAIEFSPYWLTAHPKLTFEGYYQAGVGQRIVQTLGLSLGTSRLEPTVTDGPAGTAVAFGFRTTPFGGSANPQLAAVADSLRELQVGFGREALDQQEAAEKRVRESHPDLTDEQVDSLVDPMVDSLLPEVWAKYEAAIATAGGRMQTLDNERVGLLVDLAGAMVVDFPGDVADSGFVSRVGLWVAPAYRPVDGKIELIALARYLLDRRDRTDDRSQFDFGLRSILNIGALAGSLEAVEHAGDDLPNGQAPSYRLAASFEYRVGASTAVSFTFGRDDREDEPGEGAGIVARLAINLGMGQIPLLQLGGAK